jgi:hypothetical protein
MEAINFAIGLVSASLSLIAVLTARRASVAIAQFRTTQRNIEFLRRIESAIQAAREIQDSNAQKWPKGRCDTLREILAAWQEDHRLTRRERDTVRKAGVELRIPRENDDNGRRWIRELIDDLIVLQQGQSRNVEDAIA